MVDLFALRLRADRRLANGAVALQDEMLVQAVYVLCDEVERLRGLLGPEYHVAQIGADGWSFQHPVACRPDLLACRFNEIAQHDWQMPPAPLGRYRADLAEYDRIVLSPLEASDG